MARVKLSEFRAKKILQDCFEPYVGVGIDVLNNDVGKALSGLSGKLVVKVDQATKKRNKLGLVKLNRTKKQAADDVAGFSKAGFRFALVEPMEKHPREQEHFLALIRNEEGVEIQYSDKGGVDVEEFGAEIQKEMIGLNQKALPSMGNINKKTLAGIINIFNKAHMVYLEINPLLITSTRLIPLDAAVEVDSAAEFIVPDIWTKADWRFAAASKTPSEQIVEDLQATSMSSLTLRALNPNGKIFLLLSGGGASVVIADEFDARGLAGELANYGEYSGNPNAEEVFIYTSAVIKLIKSSKAKQKVLVIAGGIANFTDVAVTFKGIINAIKQEAAYFRNNRVAVYVRRGGPNQVKGLKLMEDFLAQAGISHKVYGPEVSLAKLVKEVAEAVSK